MELSEVPAYIKDNLSGNLTIKNLSRLCFSNPTSFKLDFKDAFGETFGKYVTRMKMYKAAEMLTSGNYKKVEQIGEAMGYANMGNFAKAFRRVLACTPHEVHIKPARFKSVKEKDKHTLVDASIKLVSTCPKRLQDDFENHFGKPITAFIAESRKKGIV